MPGGGAGYGAATQSLGGLLKGLGDIEARKQQADIEGFKAGTKVYNPVTKKYEDISPDQFEENLGRKQKLESIETNQKEANLEKTRRDMAEEMYKRSREGKTENLQVPGAEIQKGFLPADTDAKAVRDQLGATKQLELLFDRVQQKISNKGVGLLPSPDMKSIGADIAELKLAIKDAAALGQLTAPDIELIENQFIDPTGFAARSGYYSEKDILDSFERARQVAREKMQARASARGYDIKDIRKGLPPLTENPYEVLSKRQSLEGPGISDRIRGFLGGQEKREVPAVNLPKVGTIIDGYEYKGGDLADQKNWEKKK